MRGGLRTLSAAGLMAGVLLAPSLAAANDVSQLRVASTALRGSIPEEDPPGLRIGLPDPVAEADDAVASDSRVIARIDLSDQRMYVYVGGEFLHEWKVSSGAVGYGTPTGFYAPEWLSPRHRSRKYNNAPMPWAVFFYKGFAVHGTTDIRRLGRPASHGCVRLHPEQAKIFFQLVRRHGMDATVISVVN